MLSIRDCLDYCDLDDEQVSLIAEHEHLETAAAAQMMCGLAQNPQGVAILACTLFAILREAQYHGDSCLQRRAEHALSAFLLRHPLSQKHETAL